MMAHLSGFFHLRHLTEEPCFEGTAVTLSIRMSGQRHLENAAKLHYRDFWDLSKPGMFQPTSLILPSLI